MPFLFGEYAHHFAHTPAWSSEDLQPINTRDQQGYAIVPNHSDAFRIAVESLKFEAGDVDSLQLFGGVHGFVIGNRHLIRLPIVPSLVCSGSNDFQRVSLSKMQKGEDFLVGRIAGKRWS